MALLSRIFYKEKDGKQMGKFRFYHIHDGYVDYLHKVDNRVQLNKGQRRPYVGIVLSINGFDYYVPLESPKPNHVNIKSSGPVFKLDGGELGIMGFNNMIPVKRYNLIEFDILAEQDEKYKNLLLNQLRFCEKNKNIILSRAQATYRKALDGKNAFYRKICCDFKRLENACNRYRVKKITKPD